MSASRPGSCRAALMTALLALASCGGASNGTARTAALSDPERPGAFSYTRWQTSFDDSAYGIFDATAFVPADDGSSQPWPTVVLLNGFVATAPMMTWLSTHLASHGYLVLGVTPPNPLLPDPTEWARGFSGGAELLVRESLRADSPLAGQVDDTRLGAIGLSMGGAGALEIAGTETLFRAIVALAPGWSDVGSFIFDDTLAATRAIGVPTQIQRGSRDCLVPAAGPLAYYDAIPATKQYLEINGGNHIGYINEDLATLSAPIIFDLVPVDCPPTTSYAEQHRLGAKYATMWFDKYLYGSDRWDDALVHAGVAADLASGALSQGMSEGVEP